MEITANHAHVFQPQVREDGSLEALKRLMDDCGIARAVTFAPFAGNFDQAGGTPNRWLMSQIRDDDRFFGFGTIDFARGDLTGQVEEIASLGLCGIKMHAAAQHFRVDAEAPREVYAAAERLGLPISFHTGIHWSRLKNDHVLLYDEVARDYPKLRFILEHVGGYSFFQDAVAVMLNDDNVYAGLTSVFDRQTLPFWYLGEERVQDLLWLTGCTRSIFGLDFPYNGEAEIRRALAAVDHLGLPEQDAAAILGNNLLRLIGR